MKLSEKIFTCRKKMGMSQEALAEKLNVSRQAVSKWETGEALPELGKMKLLSEALEVSVDWLLSDDESETPEQDSREKKEQSGIDIDRLPRVIRHLAKKYGWLAGVMMTIHGGLIMAMGLVARMIVKRMMFPAADLIFGDGTMGPATSFLHNNPVYLVGGFIAIVGAVVMVAGIVLSIWLHSKRPK